MLPDQQIFEYDVFLSFASSDEAIALPLYQGLSSGGLRVFWSGASLKEKVGDSWFKVVESALERSRHFVLLATTTSMGSKWVRREYEAFLSFYHRDDSRRLVPILVGEYKADLLPTFLRGIQSSRLDTLKVEELVKLLGGTDVPALKAALAEQEQRNRQIEHRLEATASELGALRSSWNEFEQTNRELLQKQESSDARIELLTNSLKEKEQANQGISAHLQAASLELNSLKASLSEREREKKGLAEHLQAVTTQVSLLKEENAALTRELERRPFPPPAPPMPTSKFAVLQATSLASSGCTVSFAILLLALRYSFDAGVRVGLVSFVVFLVLCNTFAWKIILPNLQATDVGILTAISVIPTLIYLPYMLSLWIDPKHVVSNLLQLLLVGGFGGAILRFVCVSWATRRRYTVVNVNQSGAAKMIVSWGAASALGWALITLTFRGSFPGEVCAYSAWSCLFELQDMFWRFLVGVFVWSILTSGSLFNCFRRLSTGESKALSAQA